MVTIYALICRVNGKGYVGSTKGKTAKRFREHRCLLNQGAHKTRALQEDWQIYGPEQFRLMDLIAVPNGDLETRRRQELAWMEYFATHCGLYNEHRISMRPSDEAIRKGVANAHLQPGNRWTPEVNEKRRVAQLGKPKGHGAKISATKRARRNQADDIV
jgi:hypothetical protein